MCSGYVTGRVCARMCECTWHPVLYVWHVNIRVRGGHQLDMSQWSSLGSCSNGLARLIGYVSQGKSICVGDGGLFLPMDGGLSTSGQNRVVRGGRFLLVCCVSVRNA